MVTNAGRRKRRSGWKHPLDINRNRRRCAKRRRSASARARRTLETLRTRETWLELIETPRATTVAPRGWPHGRPERRSSLGFGPRTAR